MHCGTGPVLLSNPPSGDLFSSVYLLFRLVSPVTSSVQGKTACTPPRITIERYCIRAFQRIDVLRLEYVLFCFYYSVIIS